LSLLEVVSRAALALLGAGLAVMIVGSLRRGWRSMRGILAGTSPDPESWDIVRAFHAPVFRSAEIVAGLVALTALLLVPFERSLAVVFYGWVLAFAVSGADAAVLGLWRRRSRPGTQTSGPRPADPGPALVLSAQEQGWTFTIPPGGQAVLGRDQGHADVCLPDISVARRHAQVQARGGSWHIEDLRSHCGIFVNDVAIRGQQTIRPGDIVRVGRIRLTVLAPETTRGSTALREATR
jgi:hypothetical protein